MEKLRQILKVVLSYGLFGILVSGVCFWLWRNPIYNPAGPQAQLPVSQIEIRFKNVTVKGRKNGTAYWVAKSKLVESERNSSRVYFKDKPSGEFYNLKDWSKTEQDNNLNSLNLGNNVQNQQKDRLRTFIWNADIAEYNVDTEDLSLKNNVKIVTDDKDKINTDELIWLNSQEKAISNKRSTIISSKGHPIIKADKIEGNVKLDVLDLKGNVDITTEITEDQQL